MIKLSSLASAVAVCALVSSPLYADTSDVTEGSPFYYNSGSGGEALPAGNPEETTDSGINHLPVYYGSMQTNNTYRMVNVGEQVFTMIGDGKHGLWRVHENGFVREYLNQDAIAGSAGLAEGSDVFDDASLASIQKNYTHHDSPASFGGYIAQENEVNADGNLNYVDLPINHPKYEGKYDKHVPIDLPHWYCTMSAPEYPLAREVMNFAYGQPGANVIGPLGKRAGLDIKENYLNVVRLDLFPDARAWVNTLGVDNFDFKAIDAKKTPFEVYLYERPFFNEEYLFITVVFADSNPYSRNFSYVRPDGTYFDHLKERYYSGEDLPYFNTRLRHQPRFGTLRDETAEDDYYQDYSHWGWGWGHKRGGKRRAVNTGLYGIHHPGRPEDAIKNGACPSMGGDFGADFYGASWPTTYQEVTPLCDAVLIDIKLWANLDGESWYDPKKNLANAGSGKLTTEHLTFPGTYGKFTDEYLVNKGARNREQYTTTGDPIIKTYKTIQDSVKVNPALPGLEPSL